MTWSGLLVAAAALAAAGMFLLSAILAMEFERMVGLRKIRRYFQMERMARRKDTRALARFLDRYADDLDFLRGLTAEQIAELMRSRQRKGAGPVED